MKLRRTLKYTLYTLAALLALFVLFVVGYNTVMAMGLSKYESSLELPEDGGPVPQAAPYTLLPQSGKANEAVMLVHGFGDCPQDFSTIPSMLSEGGYAVRATLLAGHGRTPRDLNGVTLDAHLQHLQQEYSELHDEYDKVHLVAFSFGGTLSTIVAARAKRQPASLALMAPCFKVSIKRSFLLAPEQWALSFGWMIPYVSKIEAFPPTNDPSMRGKVFSYRYVPTSSVIVLHEAELVARSTEILSDITCPALFVHSVNDRVASYDASRSAFDMLGTHPESKEFVELHRSNHLLMWDYDRDKVSRELAEFFGISYRPAQDSEEQ